jgi:hypothetical protein
VSRFKFIGSDAAARNRASSLQPPRRPLSRPKRIVFTALAVVMVWGLLEIAGLFLLWLATGLPFAMAETQKLRRFHQSQFDPRKAEAVSQVHPYLGYVLEPGSYSGIHRFADERVIAVSDFGYVDDKLPLQTRSSDRLVIGITGGSVACFFAVNGEKRLKEALTRDPRFAGKQFVVVNLAISGYKQPQQAMTLSYLLSLGAEFDFIVNIDGFNEVGLDEFDEADHRTFPAFPRLWRGRIIVQDGLLRVRRDRLLSIEADRADLSRQFSRPPWRYSPLANVLWVLLDRRMERQVSAAIDAFHSAARAGSDYPALGPRHEFATSQERYEFLAQIWADSSILMDRMCDAYGMRYFHFLQPNQYVAGSKPMLEAEREIAITSDHPYSKGVEHGYPLLIRKGETLGRQGVAYHDLTRIFAGHTEMLYMDDCCHYNQAGYEIMAESIARWICSDLPATRTD